MLSFFVVSFVLLFALFVIVCASRAVSGLELEKAPAAQQRPTWSGASSKESPVEFSFAEVVGVSTRKAVRAQPKLFCCASDAAQCADNAAALATMCVFVASTDGSARVVSLWDSKERWQRKFDAGVRSTPALVAVESMRGRRLGASDVRPNVAVFALENGAVVAVDLLGQGFHQDRHVLPGSRLSSRQVRRSELPPLSERQLSDAGGTVLWEKKIASSFGFAPLLLRDMSVAAFGFRDTDLSLLSIFTGRVVATVPRSDGVWAAPSRSVATIGGSSKNSHDNNNNNNINSKSDNTKNEKSSNSNQFQEKILYFAQTASGGVVAADFTPVADQLRQVRAENQIQRVSPLWRFSVLPPSATIKQLQRVWLWPSPVELCVDAASSSSRSSPSSSSTCVVLVGCVDSTLRAIRSENGKLAWKFTAPADLGGGISSPVVPIEGESAFLLQTDGGVLIRVALPSSSSSSSSPSPVWTVRVNERTTAPLVVATMAGGKHVFAAMVTKSRLIIVDVASGKVVSTHKLHRSGQSAAAAGSTSWLSCGAGALSTDGYTNGRNKWLISVGCQSGVAFVFKLELRGGALRDEHEENIVEAAKAVIKSGERIMNKKRGDAGAAVAGPPEEVSVSQLIARDRGSPSSGLTSIFGLLCLVLCIVFAWLRCFGGNKSAAEGGSSTAAATGGARKAAARK